MSPLKQIELLCPAKDLESGRLAINYGADAIYVGAGKFGARAGATNNLKDIEQLVRYAHLFRAKVFVTLNTILYDHELDEAEKLIHDLYQLGADALIIQDMGILKMNLPPIPLHASTQTHNYDLERIKFLDRVGFERIILARELSVTEIKNIRQNTQVELEAFVHGALCVSLSGQCYFSQAISGRSANRGECAQACRMKFNLLDGNGNTIQKNKHFLSLKDFNASAKLAEMMDAGIASFKIEGRLKDKAYVINNTAYYRKLIDNLLNNRPNHQKSSSGHTLFSFEPDPEKTFNRGYTSYFLDGRKPEMASFDSPKSKGKLIGTIKLVGKNFLQLNTSETLANGDGLCFVDDQGQLQGFNINQSEANKIFPARMPSIKVGTEIYRNFDKNFSKQIENNRDRRKINIELTFIEYPQGFVLKAEDEDGIQVEKILETDKIPANNPDLARQNMIKQFSKTGDTYFEVTKVNIQLSNGFFIPAGILNQLKRDLIELISEKRLASYPKPQTHQDVSKPDYPQTKLDYRGNIANKLAQRFYTNHGVTTTEPAFEILKKEEFKEKVIMTTRYCLKYELGLCPTKQQPNRKLKEPLLLQDEHRSYLLEFDCHNCLMKIKY